MSVSALASVAYVVARAGGTPLATGTSVVTFVLSGGSVTLPDDITNGYVWVINQDPTNALPINPPYGGQIDALGADAPVYLKPGGGETVLSSDNPSVQWYSADHLGSQFKRLVLIGTGRTPTEVVGSNPTDPVAG